MALIADGLMIAAALTASIYCFVLSRRIRRLADLDGGVGAAIAQLGRQADGMKEALGAAKRASTGSVRELRELTLRAEAAQSRLELLLASVHDGTPITLDPRRRRTRWEEEIEAEDRAARNRARQAGAERAPPPEDTGPASGETPQAAAPARATAPEQVPAAPAAPPAKPAPRRRPLFGRSAPPAPAESTAAGAGYQAVRAAARPQPEMRPEEDMPTGDTAGIATDTLLRRRLQAVLGEGAA